MSKHKTSKNKNHTNRRRRQRRGLPWYLQDHAEYGYHGEQRVSMQNRYGQSVLSDLGFKYADPKMAARLRLHHDPWWGVPDRVLDARIKNNAIRLDNKKTENRN